MLTIANREFPVWARKRLDPDDLVQDTYVEGVRRGMLANVPWMAQALRNNVLNAVRAHLCSKRNCRAERHLLIREIEGRGTSAEYEARVAEGLSRLTPAQHRALFDPNIGNGESHGLRTRAKAALQRYV